MRLKIIVLLLLCCICLSACTETTIPPACEENTSIETNPTILPPTHIGDNEIETIDKELSPTVDIEEDVIYLTAPFPVYILNALPNKGRDIITIGEFTEEEMRSIEEMEKLLDSFPANISLSIYTTNGSRGLIYNGKQQYFSACTIKIPWMLYLCKGIDEGKYSKDDVLTYEARHYHGGSGKIRYNSYGSKYTVEELIILCLSISDNVAYKMLVEYVDRNDFYEYIDPLGYPSLHVPSWSIWSSNAIARDFCGIWIEVYEYFTENDTKGTRILREACTNTRFNYGTETLIGEDYSHKSGENYGKNCAFNDAGIVWAETPYVYAIFTKTEGTKDDAKLVDNIMTIVHNIF